MLKKTIARPSLSTRTCLTVVLIALPEFAGELRIIADSMGASDRMVFNFICRLALIDRGNTLTLVIALRIGD
ncbi:MAG: hypothetical protein JKY89_09670 [Immundisolibacteraceae bacterium]|nr:hypothetical protein [Immundisolibacteraceae bacterium]